MTKKNKNVKTLWEDSTDLLNLNKQLTILRENRRKITEDEVLYYNEKQDLFDMKHYYHKIQKAEIKDHLFFQYHELIDKTHKNRVPYFISKDLYLYTWVDLQPDGTVSSIYTGDTKDPKSMILEDYVTIGQRYEEFQRCLQRIHKKEYELVKELKMIESKLKLNTEHIVPQSWFGGLEPMKGDLHHLFICQPECNIARSNYPFDDFQFYDPDSKNEKIHNHCGVTSNDRFEPENGKGAVARAMLYFLLRYPKSIRKAFRVQISIPLLTDWHQKFPVTLHEKHRNQAIFQIQGNRNPFIDFPELIEEIKFHL